MKRDSSKSRTIFAATALLLLPTGHAMGQQPQTAAQTPTQTPAQPPAQPPAKTAAPIPVPIPIPAKAPTKTATPAPSTAAADIADFFSQVGNRIYEHCIFELSQEQLEVQQALIEAYIKQGATNALARQLAIKQIQPPELSDECKQLKDQAKVPPAASVATPWLVTTRKTDVSFPKVSAKEFTPAVPLADKQVLPQWDCAPGVNYVTIQHRGYERKLTDGEICSPFEDIVHNVPEALKSFRLGYSISTGRLFVVAS